MQTLEAIVDSTGTLRLPSAVRLPKNRRAILTILDEEPAQSPLDKKQKLIEAFKRLAEKDIFPDIEDPVEWQRKLRDEWE